MPQGVKPPPQQSSLKDLWGGKEKHDKLEPELLRITSKKKDVNRDVFSIRFVVASIRANTFARAAYGTLVCLRICEVYRMETKRTDR